MLAVIAAGFALCLVSQSQAQTTWNNTDLVNGGDWLTSANWSPAAVPTGATETRINNGGRANLTNGTGVTRALTVGDSSAGNRLNVFNSQMTTRGLTLGNLAGSSGSVTIGTGSVWSTDGSGAFSAVAVGLSGTGVMVIESGATLNSGRSRIAVSAGSFGEATVRGTWRWDSTESVGIGAGTGVLNIGAGGLVNLVGTTQTLSLSSASTLNIGGSVTAETAGRLNAATVNGTGAATVNFNHTGTNYVFRTEANSPIAIAGTTSVNQKQGTTVLTAANTYTGSTRITGGTLIVNGSLSASSAVSVTSGGTLGGSGSVGNVVVNGSLAPGTSIGTLMINDLNIGATGTFSVELGRSGITPESDRVNVGGGFSLANGANLTLTLATGFSTPVIGDVFFLTDKGSAGAITGVFTQLNGVATTLEEGSTFTWNFQEYQITYLADYGTSGFTGGNDIALKVIPEPSVLALFGCGAVALGCRRRAKVSCRLAA